MIECTNSLSIGDILSSGISLFAALIVIWGWEKTARQNREHAIFQERLKKRLDMFDSLQSVARKFSEGGVLENQDYDNLNKAYVLVQLYGYDEEIKTFKKLADAIANATTTKGIVPEEIGREIHSMLLSIRKELNVLTGCAPSH